MVCHRVQPGTPAISYKLITTIKILAIPILHRASCILHPYLNKAVVGPYSEGLGLDPADSLNPSSFGILRIPPAVWPYRLIGFLPDSRTPPPASVTT